MMTANERLTIGDLKNHRGPVMAWVNVFGEDGEYIKVSKAEVLRQVGADVPYSRDGIDPATALNANCRVSDGIFYID